MKITRPIFLSLGCNQGNCFENLQNGIEQIADSIGKIVQVSSVYKTKSWGFKSDDFLNICIEVSTNLNPEMLWEQVLQIETLLGRNRTNSKEYQARTIDIDILLFDDEIIFSKDLIVPHSKMLTRNFVLIPLAEIAPHFKHPILKNNIQVCQKNCLDKTEVIKTDFKLIKPLS